MSKMRFKAHTTINPAIGVAGFLATALLLRAVALRAMEKERRTRPSAAQEIDLHIRTDSPKVELQRKLGAD